MLPDPGTIPPIPLLKINLNAFETSLPLNIFLIFMPPPVAGTAPVPFPLCLNPVKPPIKGPPAPTASCPNLNALVATTKAVC